MAFKPYPYRDQVKPDGAFVHAETKKDFEFIYNSVAPFTIEVNGKLKLTNVQIFVGPLGEDTRRAYLTKSRAYVVVDEDAKGWVVEKWNITKHRSYGL